MRIPPLPHVFEHCQDIEKSSVLQINDVGSIINKIVGPSALKTVIVWHASGMVTYVFAIVV